RRLADVSPPDPGGKHPRPLPLAAQGILHPEQGLSPFSPRKRPTRRDLALVRRTHQPALHPPRAIRRSGPPAETAGRRSPPPQANGPVDLDPDGRSDRPRLRLPPFFSPVPSFRRDGSAC